MSGEERRKEAEENLRRRRVTPSIWQLLSGDARTTPTRIWIRCVLYRATAVADYASVHSGQVLYTIATPRTRSRLQTIYIRAHYTDPPRAITLERRASTVRASSSMTADRAARSSSAYATSSAKDAGVAAKAARFFASTACATERRGQQSPTIDYHREQTLPVEFF